MSGYTVYLSLLDARVEVEEDVAVARDQIDIEALSLRDAVNVDALA